MADSLSSIQEFIKPQVGGSAGSWGGKLNGDFDSIDSLISIPRVQRQTLADGSVTWTISAGTVAKMTVTQATTIGFSGFATDTTPFKPAQRVLIQITGNGTHDVTFTGVTWLSGITPSFIAATVFYVEIFTVDNGTTKYGAVHNRVQAGQIVASMLASDSVTTIKILDANVTTSKLADDAVDSTKVAAAYPRRVKLHLPANQSLPANTATDIVWTGPTEDYNVGTWITSTGGIKVPATDTASHLLILSAQLALQDAGDPSSDDQAVVRVWIEDASANILAESWVGTDAQNGNATGWRIQVRAEINNPGSSTVYKVRAQSYGGAGTRNILQDKTFFTGILF